MGGRGRRTRPGGPRAHRPARPAGLPVPPRRRQARRQEAPATRASRRHSPPLTSAGQMIACRHVAHAPAVVTSGKTVGSPTVATRKDRPLAVQQLTQHIEPTDADLPALGRCGSWRLPPRRWPGRPVRRPPTRSSNCRTRSDLPRQPARHLAQWSSIPPATAGNRPAVSRGEACAAHSSGFSPCLAPRRGRRVPVSDRGTRRWERRPARGWPFRSASPVLGRARPAE